MFKLNLSFVKITIFYFIIEKCQNINNENIGYELNIFNNLENKSKFNNESIPPKNRIDEYFFNIRLSFIEYFLTSKGNRTDIINHLSQQCLSFIGGFINIFSRKRSDLEILTEKLLRGGIISNAIGLEDECLEKDEVYIFISGNFSYDNVKLNKEGLFREQHMLFIESLFFHEEICLWKQCVESYQSLFDYIVKYEHNSTKRIFGCEQIKIEGINYYTNYTNKILYSNENNINNTSENDIEINYIKYIQTIIIIISIFLIFSTFLTICIENREYKKNDKNYKVNSEFIESDDNLKNNILIAKEETYKDNHFYKFISSFNILKNFLLLSKIKEPLSNQTSLVELSTIRLIIIFFIMIGENIYIILKYVDKGISLITLIRSWSFVFIKIGTISYEYYKVICGIIFGFKFINYYKKEKNFNCKRIMRFISKFIPYLVIFLIIHYGFNYPISFFTKYFFKSIRTNFISNKMNECYCQQDIYSILNPFNIMTKYNSTNYNIGQYNGCYRPILFTISEFFSFFMVLFITIFFLMIKSKVLEYLFFFINFIYLGTTYFITKETKDLIGEYTISRLFGLSGTIAIPYLFFPLYYIGFNIGIAYYYSLHQVEVFNESFSDKYIPFEYNYRLIIFIGRLPGKIRNVILFICLILMVSISSKFSFIMNSLDISGNKLIFDFEEFPITKFMYVYEGIISGLIFSIFIIIYLTLNPNNIFKIILSSDLFILGHKISFILFNSFYSILKFSHGINILEIYLSTLYIVRNTVTLFIESILSVIFFSVLIFFPIKWIYFYIINGFDNHDDDLE